MTGYSSLIQMKWSAKSLPLRYLAKKAQLKDGKSAYSVYRIGDFLGRWLDRGEHFVRLYNRKYHAIKDCLVHEAIDVEYDQVVKMKGVLWHYGFRSIHDHIQRFNKYTDLEAKQPISIPSLFVYSFAYSASSPFLSKIYFPWAVIKKELPASQFRCSGPCMNIRFVSSTMSFPI